MCGVDCLILGKLFGEPTRASPLTSPSMSNARNLLLTGTWGCEGSRWGRWGGVTSSLPGGNHGKIYGHRNCQQIGWTRKGGTEPSYPTTQTPTATTAAHCMLLMPDRHCMAPPSWGRFLGRGQGCSESRQV